MSASCNIRYTAGSSGGRFHSASGTLDGTAFSTEDFFQLVYLPGHHHFTRNFAVLFDAPIGKACGIRIEAVNNLDGDVTAVVSTAGCDLAPLETRAVSAETYTIGE